MNDTLMKQGGIDKMILEKKDFDAKEFDGFHEVSDEELIPGIYIENPFICPFGIEGYCEGFKDAEYSKRCEVSQPIKLLDCKIYNHFIDLSRNYPQQRNESIHDTVIMSAEDVVNWIDYSSLQDRVDDGEDALEIFENESYLNRR